MSYCNRIFPSSLKFLLLSNLRFYLLSFVASLCCLIAQALCRVCPVLLPQFMCGWRESSGLESVMGCPSKCHLAVLESGEAAATKALLWLWLVGCLALAAWTSWASFTLRFLNFSRNWRKAAERQPKRQAARHNDGDKSLSSSVSTRNAAESTNMSAAGVWWGRGGQGDSAAAVALGTCQRSDWQGPIQRLLTQIVHNQF